MATDTPKTDVPRKSEADLHYGHPRMPLSERAKIFLPFDTLKGFRDALAEQEREAAKRQ